MKAPYVVLLLLFSFALTERKLPPPSFLEDPLRNVETETDFMGDLPGFDVEEKDKSEKELEKIKEMYEKYKDQIYNFTGDVKPGEHKSDGTFKCIN